MVKTPSKWLITGGCGFIGIALIRYLLANHLADTIRVVDNLSVGTRKSLAKVAVYKELRINQILPMEQLAAGRVELVVADICDRRIAEKAAAGADIIIHLAANTGVQPSIKNPVMDMTVNIMGLLSYLEAARKTACPGFVFASSGAPVGNTKPPIHENLPCRPVSPYGASKLAGEGYCSAYHGSFALRTVALRFSNVYGPGSGHKTSLVAKLIMNAKTGKDWIINGDGLQTRDFIFINDLVKAICLAACKGKPGNIYQIATGQETSVIGLANQLADIIKKTTGIVVSIRHVDPLTGDVRSNYSDTSKARHGLGWRPEMELGPGLAKTVNWFFKT